MCSLPITIEPRTPTCTRCDDPAVVHPDPFRPSPRSVAVPAVHPSSRRLDRTDVFENIRYVKMKDTTIMLFLFGTTNETIL